MKLLSVAYADRLPVRYAHCQSCNLVYQDDMPIMGSIECPTCPHVALTRGLTFAEADRARFGHGYDGLVARMSQLLMGGQQNDRLC